MSEIRYIISDASKRLDVEPHVLRYWEEELELSIPRNELGHRYYREEDLLALENIKVLKEQGFQLKAIKMLLSNMGQAKDFSVGGEMKLTDEELKPESESKETLEVQTSSENKFEQFKFLMQGMFEDVLQDNNQILSESVSETVIKQMDYLLRLKEEREEDRYKKLDETIREFQKMRQETATTKKSKGIGIKGLLKKK